MCAANPLEGKYLTTSCIFRGNVSTKEVEDEMSQLTNKNS
jgi:tubulin beta